MIKEVVLLREVGVNCVFFCCVVCVGEGILFMCCGVIVLFIYIKRKGLGVFRILDGKKLSLNVFF